MEKNNLTFGRFLKRLIYFPTWILIIASYIFITLGPFAIFWLIAGRSMYIWWTDKIEDLMIWFDIEIIEDDDEGHYY